MARRVQTWEASCVDGIGELVGFGEQMARTNGRYRPSVSPAPTVQHQVSLVGYV